MGAPSSPHPVRTLRLCPGCWESGWRPWDTWPLTWAAVAAVWRSRDSSQRQRATMRAISIGFSKYLLCKGSNTPRSADTGQPLGSPHSRGLWMVSCAKESLGPSPTHHAYPSQAGTSHLTCRNCLMRRRLCWYRTLDSCRKRLYCWSISPSRLWNTSVA